MNDAQLVQAVTKYKTKREQIKSRQKRDLEDEVAPWKADIGEEIVRVRAEKNASIQDIADIIGVQNRTFIYDMIRAYKITQGEVPAPTFKEIEADINYTDTNIGDAPYLITFGDSIARVEFPPYGTEDSEWYDLPIIDGTPDVPEEWGEHTRERRDLYKQIIAEIKKHG